MELFSIRIQRTFQLVSTGNAVQPIIAHYLFECIKEFDRQLEQTVGENE